MKYADEKTDILLKNCLDMVNEFYNAVMGTTRYNDKAFLSLENKGLLRF